MRGAGTRASAVGVGLIVLAVSLLIASGAVGPGDPPGELRGPWLNLAFLCGLLAVGLAVVAQGARRAVGGGVLAVTALIAAGGMTGVLGFYDSVGLGLALGIGCLVASWLILSARRRRPPWSEDLPRRFLAYLTLGVVLIPATFSAGVTHSCAGVDSDDDLCGLDWLLIGVPVTCLVWLLAVGVAEVAAARRRRAGDRSGHRIAGSGERFAGPDGRR